MPLVVERVGDNLFSLAHYGEQNGDLMADPEMVVLCTEIGWCPVSFRNDYVGVRRECVRLDAGERITHVAPREKRDQTSFLNTWLKNLRHQQGV